MQFMDSVAPNIDGGLIDEGRTVRTVRLELGELDVSAVLHGWTIRPRTPNHDRHRNHGWCGEGLILHEDRLPSCDASSAVNACAIHADLDVEWMFGQDFFQVEANAGLGPDGGAYLIF